MTSWWDGEDWKRYEVAYGDEPGTRARLLASAEWSTQIVDLSQDEATLWKCVRRSYHAIVNRAEKDQSLVWDTVSGCYSTVCQTVCRMIHDEVAGRQTRSAETWELMDDWIRSGHGLVTYVSRRVRDGAEPIGYTQWILQGQWAYYSSAASLQPNVNHALVWRAMKALKARWVRWCELGWQGQASDEKGKNIEMFRRGFSSLQWPVRDVWTRTQS